MHRIWEIIFSRKRHEEYDCYNSNEIFISFSITATAKI